MPMTCALNEMPTISKSKQFPRGSFDVKGIVRSSLVAPRHILSHTHLLGAQPKTVRKCLEYYIKAVCLTSQSY